MLLDGLTNGIWQVDATSRLNRSRHDKEQLMLIALEKSTKHKNNLATNEVRVE